MTAKSKTIKSRERLLKKPARRDLGPPRTDKDPTGRRLLQTLDAFKK